MRTHNRLITIPPSHYCEKARWALQLAGLEFVEEAHPPLLHLRAVRAAGGRRSTPVLVTGDGVFADSTDILRYLDRMAEARWRPYPRHSGPRAEVEGLEDRFDTALGPHTRRLAYFYLLPRRRMVLSTLLAGVNGWERAAFRLLRPAIVALMRRGMRIDREGRRRSLERVREVFAEVGGRLENGRRYLVGERFTAADLTFAALAAPAVLAPGYGAPLPALDELPEGYRDLIAELRATPAGAFILRCYEDHR